MHCGDRWGSPVSHRGIFEISANRQNSPERCKPRNIELEDLPGIADSARRNAEQVETSLTTTDDQPIDTAWVTQAKRAYRARKRNDGSERLVGK